MFSLGSTPCNSVDKKLAQSAWSIYSGNVDNFERPAGKEGAEKA